MKEKTRNLKVVSIFSGCGGMDLGFEGGFIVHKDSINKITHPKISKSQEENGFVRLKTTRFKTVFANDILKEASLAWTNYFSRKQDHDKVYHLESIVDLVKKHKESRNIFPLEADIVTGGFPCQDFSLAGKRNGFKSHKDHNGNIIKDNEPSVETRGQLYMWLKEVIDIVKPKIFIAENVKGLANLSNVKDIIQADFSTADDNGYIVLDPVVLQAADYGVPQSRERVIFIGIKKSALCPTALDKLTQKKIEDSYYPYPRPSHAYKSKGNNLKPPTPVASVLKSLDEPEFSLDPSQIYFSRAKYMGSHCQGQIEVNLTSVSPTIRAEHHGNIEFRRLSRENGGKILHELDLSLKERRLTPRECALIQTFPPDYDFVTPKTGKRFVVSPSAAYKIIGNAVPPLLAFHIANRLEEVWSLYFDDKSDKTNF